MNLISTIDQYIANFLFSLRTDTLNQFIILLTNPGMVMGTLLVSVYLFFRKKTLLISLGVIAASLSVEIAFLLKELFKIPRPYLLWEDFLPVTLASGHYSFPSMHAAFVFSLIQVIKQTNEKWLHKSWIIFATLIAFTRIYLGVHTLSDIIFGAVVGYSISLLVCKLDSKYNLLNSFFHHIRNTFEFRRQIVHTITGIGIIVLIRLEMVNTPVFIGILAAGGLVSFLSRKYRLPFIGVLLDYFERDKKRHSFPGQGSFFLVLGSFLAYLLFDRETACASIAIMAVGDSITNIVGTFFGRYKNPFNQKKHLEGTFMAIIVSTLAAWYFVPLIPAFLASFSSMILESLDLKIGNLELDDNLFIPIIAGITILLAST